MGELALANSADSILGVCLARFGRVDALFNAAGLSGRRFGDGPVHLCSDEGWDVTLQQNLKVMFQMSRAAIGRMLQQEPQADGVRGAILNMGSVLADAPEPRHFDTHAYAAAKGAVVALSRSMAAYYAPHKIRVNVLSAGLVRTPASERSQTNAELLDFLTKKQPLAAGMVDAEDVARDGLVPVGNRLARDHGRCSNCGCGLERHRRLSSREASWWYSGSTLAVRRSRREWWMKGAPFWHRAPFPRPTIWKSFLPSLQDAIHWLLEATAHPAGVGVGCKGIINPDSTQVEILPGTLGISWRASAWPTW